MGEQESNPFKKLDKKKFPSEMAKKGRKKLAAPAVHSEKSVDTENETDLFLSAMNSVTPLGRRKGRELAPAARQATRSALADMTDYSSMLDFIDGKVEFRLDFTAEYMEARVKGLDDLVMGKLKAGAYSPEAHLDLHGLNIKQAYESMINFIQRHYMAGRRCLLIVPGRGLNSPEGYGVLRAKVGEWLTSDPFKRVVLAFCTARPKDGGMGALYILLRQYRKSQGKIHWERYLPSDELY